MTKQLEKDGLKNNSFLRGLDESELDQIAELCLERSYEVGELCQIEGQPSKHVYLITQGRVGVLIRIPNVTYCNTEIIMDTLHEGDVFGWQTLIKGTPWSTLRVIEKTKVLYISTSELMKLCEKNYHIGYCLMKNLSALIASRLRRNRMSILNAIVAIKNEG